MKRTAIVALILMMTPMALLAASKNSEKVTFSETVTVNGTQIPPGEYRVEWQGTGASVEASILRAGKVVATAPATLVTGRTEFNGAFEARDGVNNSHILDAIDYANFSLHFDQANASTTNKSSVKTAE
jgi:hypothetical protein